MIYFASFGYNLCFLIFKDIDGPTLCTSRDGDIIMVMRHFKSGRKIHAYETNNDGKLLYEINIDADPSIRYPLFSV